MSSFHEECLKAHNNYRQKHGAPDLVLSEKLNNFAQNWANNLAARDTMQHSTGSGYGENIYMKWSSDPNVTASGGEAVQSWYSEISKYTYGSGFSMGTGHFTQVVWKSSKELGVGKAKSRSGRIYVVANYYPPGNYQGQFAQNVLPPQY